MPTDYKVVLVGESGVGKSNLFERFISNEFRPELKATAGGDLEHFYIDAGDGDKCVQLWDTAGQERFHSLTSTMYLKNADGVMIVYDICERSSFERAAYWRVLVESSEFVRRNVTYCLVGNKHDLRERRVVPYDEAKNWADRYGMLYHETSALTGENVQPTFRTLAAEVNRRHHETEDYWEQLEARSRGRILLEEGPTEPHDHHHACCPLA